jgi:serine/threonine protein phosphatase PrpC
MNSFYTIKQNSTVKEFSYLEDQNIAKEETMEDKGKSIENFNNDKSNILFLLFDGHGGDTISKYLQKNFDKIYKKTLKENNNNIEKSLKISFSKINSEIKKLNLNSIGSTGCIVHIKWLSESNLIIYIANCGDTRASLISPINYLRLSKDHRTDNKEEQERIINCGGNIINNRVMGMLMLTRAFGDFELEKNGVYCEPFINKVQVDLSQKNRFVILATDGIWDLNSEREIMEMIMFDNNSTSLVQNIVKNTLRKDAWDNLSIFAIKLT